MTGAEAWVERFNAALVEAKAARRRLDKTVVHVIGDARADALLIELRKALNALEDIAAEVEPATNG